MTASCASRTDLAAPLPTQHEAVTLELSHEQVRDLHDKVRSPVLPRRADAVVRLLAEAGCPTLPQLNLIQSQLDAMT